MMRANVFGAVSALLVVTAGCAVESVSTPLPTGPAEFGVSLSVSATPDVLRHDGSAVSTIRLQARDEAGRGIAGISIRLDVLVGTTQVDFGTLSSRTVSTDGSGLATTTYQSPPAPPAFVDHDTTITIRATMIGSNYANSLPRTAQILLVRPGIILPPNGTPVPRFFFSPSTARENEPVLFDASSSTDDGQIVSYVWTFGDGSSGSGRTRTHLYALAGTYLVTLTVTDDRGLSASTVPTSVPIVAAASPVASFTYSPTDPAVGRSIVFNAASSTVPTGRTLVGFDWEFGDGNQKSGVATTHAYTAPGTYTVVLTVTDNTGRKAVASRTVLIVP
ncbi:MAG: PKD domain-containing protein [Acidobacteria bacterium]|nr:PKD domain-containing protein [Acidobacteriota bacterium]